MLGWIEWLHAFSNPAPAVIKAFLNQNDYKVDARLGECLHASNNHVSAVIMAVFLKDYLYFKVDVRREECLHASTKSCASSDCSDFESEVVIIYQSLK